MKIFKQSVGGHWYIIWQLTGQVDYTAVNPETFAHANGGTVKAALDALIHEAAGAPKNRGKGKK